MSASSRRAIAKLVFAQICIHGCLTGLRMAAPLWALRNFDSALMAGLLVAMFAVSQVFLALPAGRFVERQGLRRSLAASVMIGTAGASLAAIWPNPWTLGAAALFTGAGSGMTVIALQRHVGRVASSPSERRSLFSWLAIGPSFSNFLGPLIAGVLIDVAGFRAAFAAMSVLPVVAWLAARSVVDEPADLERVEPSREPAWTMFRDRAFTRLLLVNWLLSTCWDVHSFMVPVLGHQHDFSASAIGAVLGAFAIAATMVRMLMPFIAKRLRERQVIISAQVLTALVFAVYPLVDTPLSMGALSMLLGFALGSVQPMVMSTLHVLVPPERIGQAIALRLMVVYGSSVVMPLIFGAAGATVGPLAVFWVVGSGVSWGAWLARRIGTP